MSRGLLLRRNDDLDIKAPASSRRFCFFSVLVRIACLFGARPSISNDVHMEHSEF